MSDLTTMAAQVLDSQPFSRHLGARMIEAGEGRVVIELPIADHLKQQHGFVHGGAISYLADNAITFAGGLAYGGGGALTSEFKINYLRPAVGAALIARAEVKSLGRRQAVCVCEVFAIDDAGEEKLCALAQGTVAKIE